MKKVIIAALTMLTLGATQAEYTLKIPLEQAQGGSLPNGSINIKNQIIPEQFECIDTVNRIYGFCSNGVFTGTANGRPITSGTCNGNEYSLIASGRTWVGTCNIR